MRSRPIQTSGRLVASFLAATLLVFAALPALHGTHGAGSGPADPTFAEADAFWTAAAADCPLCRGLVRNRVAPATPPAELGRTTGSLPVTERPDDVASCDVARSERARAPPALA